MEIATLIYAAECAMCRSSALWLMRRALSSGTLEILPCRSRVRQARFPQVAEERCLEAMQLVLPFEAAGGALKSLERKRVRVRGWVEQRGGPRLHASWAGQIEVVGN